MKKFFSLILSLIMLASSALPFYAFAKDSISPEMAENPFYAGKEVYRGSIDSYLPPSSKTKKRNNKTYYTKGKELYTSIKNNLEKRNTSFKIYYLSETKYSRTSQVMKLVEELFTAATEDNLSTSCTDGDYLRWAASGYGFSDFQFDTVDKGYYYYTVNLEFRYYDTAYEEEKVDAVVNSFVSGIDTNKMSDYEIVRKIHDFICSKTTYDYDAAKDLRGREYATTAYGALVKGKSICQGYAVAFYRLCRELGYNARFVSSSPDEGCHAWNIVELDGKYYFVDSTWDDEFAEQKKADYDAYTYFLVSYSSLRQLDSVDNEHALDENLYETEYFYENYRELLDDNDYDSKNKDLFSQCIVSLSKKSYTYSGSYCKPSVTITKGHSTALKNSSDFIVTYENNKDTGLARVSVKGINAYKSDKTQRNFVINPKKMTSLSLADGGRSTTSITVKWKKAGGNISGYKVEKCKNGKWSLAKTITSPSTTSVKISSLSSATSYKFRIRSYKTISKKTYYGPYSSAYKTATKPKKPAASSISAKTKSLTFKWKKVQCSGYEIQYSTNKSMKKAKKVTASSKANSKKISKLKKGKKYYVRVRAYKKYTSASGKSYKCYSSWSSKKSVKCK